MQFPQPGDLFEGKYRVERELGTGGFSRVFLVQDQTSGRLEALKIVMPEVDGYSDEMRARFDREVHMIARLQHPNTVTLFNCGESQSGLLFMVFEHVPGEDLADLLARHGRLDPGSVRAILIQLLGSLREAHEAGLIHRDIKPQNIRVCSRPGAPIEVRLLDFGIARSTDEGSPSITKTGELIGTPRYMSPEQLTERRLTPASDIYSLGMVAFELLVGSDALPGNRWGDQLDRLRSGHVFSTNVIESVGRDLLQVVQRMTEQDQASRLPSAAAVLSALEHGSFSTARRPRPPEPTAVPAPVPQARRLALGGAVLAVLVAGAVVAALMGREKTPEEIPAQRVPATKLLTRPTTEPAVEPTIASTDAGRDVADELPDFSDLGGGCRVAEPLPLDDVSMILPPNHDNRRPAPLIIWLYSHNQVTPDLVPRSSTFDPLVEQEGALIAIPRAPGVDAVQSWTGLRVGHIRRTKEALASQYCIDPERVYVWSSAGAGVLSTRLACEPWVSGVAISTYMEYAHADFPCVSPRPTLWIAPRHSMHQPIAGGEDCFKEVRRPFAETVATARKRRGCSGKPRVTYETGFARCERWQCEVAFEACEIDGGLGWPKAPQPFAASAGAIFGCAEPPPNQQFDAARHAWEFFSDLAKNP